MWQVRASAQVGVTQPPQQGLHPCRILEELAEQRRFEQRKACLDGILRALQAEVYRHLVVRWGQLHITVLVPERVFVASDLFQPCWVLMGRAKSGCPTGGEASDSSKGIKMIEMPVPCVGWWLPR